MAEVNAFSIDGTKYSLTATDQTYVGETGLAQLGLDYTCTPDELLAALVDAGGGIAILDGYAIEGDGWDMDGIANGGCCTLVMTVLDLSRATLEAHGKDDTIGEYVRHPAGSDDVSFDGTEWTTLVYGAGDTWTPGQTIYVCGWGMDADTACFTVPLSAPVAPGVTSATCTTVAGTIAVRRCDGTNAGDVTSASKCSCTLTNQGVRLDLSGLSAAGDYFPCVARLYGGFTIKFS